MATVVTDLTPWLAFFGGENCLPLELALQANALEIPALIKLEMLSAPMGKKERAALEKALSLLPTLELDKNHLLAAAMLKADLEEKGEFISVRDAHILQCAIDRNAILLSRDALFARLQDSTGVRIQLW